MIRCPILLTKRRHSKEIQFAEKGANRIRHPAEVRFLRTVYSGKVGLLTQECGKLAVRKLGRHPEGALRSFDSLEGNAESSLRIES